MNNGEKPAHPCVDTVANGERFEPLQIGLTKREYFAAMAMQGLCANSNPGPQHQPKILAIEALEYADALLKKLDAN